MPVGTNDAEKLFYHLVEGSTAYPPAAITQMPLAQQVLISGAEVFGVRGTRCCACTPARWRTHAEDGVDDCSDGIVQGIGMEIAAPNIDPVLCRLPGAWYRRA